MKLLMAERWSEFIVELGDVPEKDLTSWDKKTLLSWLKAWGAYVKTGGDRPPRPHG